MAGYGFRLRSSSFALRASEDRSSYGGQVASNPPYALNRSSQRMSSATRVSSSMRVPIVLMTIAGSRTCDEPNAGSFVAGRILRSKREQVPGPIVPAPSDAQFGGSRSTPGHRKTTSGIWLHRRNRSQSAQYGLRVQLSGKSPVVNDPGRAKTGFHTTWTQPGHGTPALQRPERSIETRRPLIRSIWLTDCLLSVASAEMNLWIRNTKSVCYRNYGRGLRRTNI
jgi:hypothetical protein